MISKYFLNFPLTQKTVFDKSGEMRKIRANVFLPPNFIFPSRTPMESRRLFDHLRYHVTCLSKLFTFM